MSCTPTEMLNVVRSQLGYREGSNNDNKYGKWYGMNHVPYCAIGLSWSAAAVGATDIMGGKWAYCPYWVNHWREVGRWHAWSETPKPGDIAFFNWAGTHGLADHVGVVESVDWITPSVPVLVTLEFNTLSGISGNQSDGGGVYRRRRSNLYVVGYGRPAYKAQSRPVLLPSRSDGRHLMPLVVDGVWGQKTTQHLQVWAGVTPDGEIGPVTRRALQRRVHVTPDGEWGPNTRRALQKVLGVSQDGQWGPRTIAALQRMLNRAV
jgi:peptidoglycan hydrolase-like protein with peptidoglycan-binding domain